MSHEHSESKPIKYTAFAVFSFVTVFCLLMLFRQCEGDYMKHDAGASHGGNAHEEHAAAKNEEHAVASEHDATKPESIKVKLINGKELEAYKGGIEDQLVSFLNNAETKGGKDVWFDFDNLNFENGKATISKESEGQIANIAAILAAYPKLKIKIGGYTDKSGNDEANKKLSQERADAVLASLKSANSNAEQLLGAEGYGSAFAKAAADAPEEEKKKDRHISIGVREK